MSEHAPHVTQPSFDEAASAGGRYQAAGRDACPTETADATDRRADRRTGAPLVAVEKLSVRLRSEAGTADAVDRISFELRPGEALALVGESGCGKTLTSLAILGLLPRGVAVVSGGAIYFEGRDLLTLPPRTYRRLRGGAIAMIFQEPMTSLNPLMTIGEQIAESVRLHTPLRGRAARRRAVELLDRVGIADARRRVDDYPHQMSGGMRQRMMIAMALAGEPRLLIADEPTTALDVTIQAQVLRLLRDLQTQTGMAMLLITHDFGVVAQTADRVAVMYAGRIVESGPVTTVLRTPLHPYTQGLLNCLPRPDRPQRRLPVIEGMVPPLHAMPAGCRFEPRCPVGRGDAQCHQEEPPLTNVVGTESGDSAAGTVEVGDEMRHVACWKAPAIQI